MQKRFYPVILALALFSFSFQSSHKKKLELSPLFSSHMVLQQQKKVDLWGKYRPEEKLTISSSWGVKISTKANNIGNWKIKIPTPKAGGPYSIKIETTDSTILIEDILIGEVWLASGQSNMSMPLEGWPPNDPILNSSQEIANANYAEIRMFNVERNLSSLPTDSLNGKWKVTSPENASNFSATAYFFARRLYKELNIPIGIIHSSWGGTAAEAWTSEKALKKLGGFTKKIERLKNYPTEHSIKEWFGKKSTQEIPKTKQQWQNISFSDSAASNYDFDDSAWSTMTLPGRFDQLLLENFNGAIWLRKEVIIQDITSDYTINIGAIDDMDATYLNGHRIGGIMEKGFWNTPRKITIPKHLLVKGKNIIAIRAIDVAGVGAIVGPMTLSKNETNFLTLEGSWKFHIISEIFNDKFYIYGLQNDISKRPKVTSLNPNIPSTLFNAMINPLIPYTISGAIWYQGESNVGRANQYKELFPAMIKEWRKKWNYDFPFYFVQIAPFKYQKSDGKDVSQKLREAQRLSLKTSKTGMVVTLDIGDINNIHPANKQDVGKRLAGLALVNNYRKDMIASGPLYKEVKKSGGKLIIDFNYKGSGLMCPEKELNGFEVAGIDKMYVPALANIVDNKIEVTSLEVTLPKYVRYAWKDNSKPSLFNLEGFPASTFTSEKK